MIYLRFSLRRTRSTAKLDRIASANVRDYARSTSICAGARDEGGATEPLVTFQARRELVWRGVAIIRLPADDAPQTGGDTFLLVA